MDGWMGGKKEGGKKSILDCLIDWASASGLIIKQQCLYHITL